MVKLNEDDVGELKSLKYKIKSVLEHPNSETFQLYGCLLDLEKIHKRFVAEGKKIPESDEYLELRDMKTLVSRFSDFLIEELEKETNESR